jgi:hypothetical protein
VAAERRERARFPAEIAEAEARNHFTTSVEDRVVARDLVIGKTKILPLITTDDTDQENRDSPRRRGVMEKIGER